MFTGLIQAIGVLQRIDRQGADAQMVVRSLSPLADLELGESIAVDGACLTVAAFQGSIFTADVSVETLSRTTLGRKAAGNRLNLERALRLGDRLGGHLVSGHVDGIGVLTDRTKDGRSWRLFFKVPAELSRYIVAKGSIAINGISLTVNGCGPDRFDVNIIPHTADQTTVPDLQIGDQVNLETDIIGKYVERLLGGWQSNVPEQSAAKGGIDAGFLQKHGFL